MEGNDLNACILTNTPTFVAVNYQRLLEMQEPQEQVTQILYMYNLTVRAMTIGLVTKYLCGNRDQVKNPDLDKLLEQKLPNLVPGDLEEILFATLRAYKDHRDLLFFTPLYDFYWDISTSPHRERTEVKVPFERLARVTLDHQMKRQPQNGWQALAQELYGHHRKVCQSFSFIARYDLICVLAQDEHTYTFELHKGLQVQVSQRPLPPHTSLLNGRFYWRNATEDFLSFHPLEVFRANE